MFTPRPCSNVSELAFETQACGQLVKVRSAEIESERETESNVKPSRSFITITGLDRNPKGPSVRSHPRPQLSLRIQVRGRDPANASAKSPLDRDGCPRARPGRRARVKHRTPRVSTISLHREPWCRLPCGSSN